MIEIGAKVVLGTVLYVVVLWAAGRNPRAAGMMLTFPTLNGIGLLLAEPTLLEGVVHSMLLMPVVNGIFCAGYLALSRRLLRRGWQPGRTSAGLLLLISAVWVIVAAGIASGSWGVGSPYQWSYGLGILGAGLLLTWLLRPLHAPGQRAGGAVRLPHVIARNRGRIALFALSLAIVATFERLGGSGSLLGILASLPLVAFFGLHSLVSDARASIEARIATLDGLGNGVWLGPAIAIFFVAAYWRGLWSLAQWTHNLTYLAAGSAGLVVGWTAAFAAIWLAASLLHGDIRRTRHQTTQ